MDGFVLDGADAITQYRGILRWYDRCYLSFKANRCRCVNNSPSQPPRPLTRELLDYWMHHPEAQDTEESIVEWWLLQNRIQQAVVEVRCVLTELIERGFVIARQQADGRNRYQLNRPKAREIQTWLATHAEPADGEGSAGGTGRRCQAPP